MANLSNINNKLLVGTNGEVRIGDTATVADVKLRIKQLDNQWPMQIVSNYAYGLSIDTSLGTDGNAGSLQIYPNSGGGFIVRNDSNVGIGTTSPNQEGFGAANIALSVKAPTSGGVANLELIGLGNNEGDEVGYVNFMSQAATNSLAAIVGIRRSDDTTGKLQFRTTGTTKFTIEDDNQIRFAGDFYLVTNTSNTADTGSLNISGGGGFGDSRGASIGLAGNENGNGGLMQLRAGDGSVGGIRYYTGGSERMRLGGRLISFNSTTGVQEIRGDVASAKFAIGNMGDASSQMMVSSRGFLTLNTSNTGSALDATERMRIDANGQMTYQGAEPGTTGIRFQGSGTCNGYAGSYLNYYAMDVMRDQGSGKAINSQGTISIADGYGIEFGASQGAGATSTLLDDYEEGTWTPAVAGVVMSSASGRYVKIGNMVKVYGVIRHSSGASTSNIVTGLPFATSGLSRSPMNFSQIDDCSWGTGATMLVSFIQGSEFDVYGNANGSGYITVPNNWFSTGAFLEFGGTYIIF